jgi:hypothetical protein
MANPPRARLRSADPAAHRAAAALNEHLHRAWRLVDEAVANRAQEWAATIGCKATESFVADVRKALGNFLVECNIEKMHPRQRPSDIAHDFDAVVKHAAAAAKQLRLLLEALDRLPVMWRDDGRNDGPDGIEGYYDVSRSVYRPRAMAEELDELVDTARRKSEHYKAIDRTPPRYRAFAVLASGLAHAYQRATGMSLVGYSAREGKLASLVNAVLPTAKDIAETAAGSTLKVPKDIGQFLDRLGENKVRDSQK